MKTLVIKLKKEDVKQAWGETIEEMGFIRDQFEDKYRKKIVTWTKDGVEYTVRLSDDGENKVFTFTEYKY